MAIWLMAWDDRATGRFIHSIIPKVSLQPINWRSRQVLFFTVRWFFPSYPQRFILAETSFRSCGGIGTPIHYGTKCLLPYGTTQQHQSVWFRSVVSNSTSGRSIHNLLHLLQSETGLFCPDPNNCFSFLY
ncbi:hypothetical protein AVEN_139983-1 [Araneus ventricosus]|uniref:Uncharacterized protein n=1 Tax=Araneus ventricosus TaxID=182803 RepID=A0A4Y2NDV6_ARAVE|nr:hypothetical protein AVEN_139983-1 [Araneus ventricosus]